MTGAAGPVPTYNGGVSPNCYRQRHANTERRKHRTRGSILTRGSVTASSYFFSHENKVEMKAPCFSEAINKSDLRVSSESHVIPRPPCLNANSPQRRCTTADRQHAGQLSRTDRHRDVLCQDLTWQHVAVGGRQDNPREGEGGWALSVK